MLESNDAIAVKSQHLWMWVNKNAKPRAINIHKSSTANGRLKTLAVYQDPSLEND